MVTYTRTPLRFTPAGNPVIFAVSGSNPDTIVYRSELIEANSGAVIYSGNIYPKPLTPSLANINLTNQLSSLVRADVDNDDSLFLGKTEPMLGYRLSTSEYGLSGGVITQLASATTSNTFYAFEAGLDSFNYTTRFVGNTYVVKPGSTGKFLTLQPDSKAVNVWGLEQLYFIQSGYTGITLNVSIPISGTVYEEVYTESLPYLISAGTPETRAMASITITGTCATDDNLTVKVNGSTLGSYSATSVSLPTTSLATGLSNALSSNGSGYTASVSGSTVYIQAPVGLGSSGNSLTLTTTYASATTVNIITGGTSATVILGSYERLPTIFEMVIVEVNDPYYGIYNIWEDVVDFSLYTPDLSGFTACLVDNINGYGGNLGYSCTQLDYNQFRITARPGLGDTMNATESWITFPSVPESYDGIWYGGITSGYSAQTTFHSIIPHSKTSFANGVTATNDLSGFTMPNMIRINVSPKKFIANGVNDLIVNQDYYIKIKDTSGNTISEIKTYKYQPDICHLEYVNILFTNSIGGVDSYQFINPQESLSVEKLKISKNNINLDSSTPYITNGVYNPIDQTYHSVGKSGIKVWTKELSDDESGWLTELVMSKNIYVELTDGSLVPVQLINTNYDIRKKKYVRSELNQYQFEFSFSEDYIPALSTAGIIING